MDSNARSNGMRYPRKRAITACQLCRTGKTKCDNQRPSCRVCLSVGIPCHYADRNDHSSFDPASLEIIDRLSRIMGTQQDILNAVRGNSNPGTCAATSQLNLASQSSLQTLSLPEDASQNGHPNTEPAANLFGVPSSNTSPDNVLMWPIFLGNFVPNSLQDAVLLSKPSGPHASQEPNRVINFAFQEEKVPKLIERFFHLVHIKNPILDHEELQKEAQRVIEDGLSWDSGSCLVLLASALGKIAQPFQNRHQVTLDASGYGELASSIDEDSDLAEAESYFSLAQRRIGILKQSVAAVQCFFLCGVFYMYTFRPLDSFQSFHQASVVYQVYSKSQKKSAPILSDSRIEQALFWSCFKSECEILSEIDLPSGIPNLDYIHVFPNPPNSEVSVATPTSTITPDSGKRLSYGLSAHGQEQAWFYFLSEIALRRIGNRVLNSFYKNGFESWKEFDITATIQIANEFLRQLNEWYECLPVPMHFDGSKPGFLPDKELPYLLFIRQQAAGIKKLRTGLFES